MNRVRHYPSWLSAVARGPVSVGIACLAICTSYAQVPRNTQLSPSARIRAMAAIGEFQSRKDHRTVLEQRIDSALLNQIDISQGVRLTAHTTSYQTGIRVNPDGTTVVELYAKISDPLEIGIRSLGATLLADYPNFGRAIVRVPLNRIHDLASMRGVSFVAREPRGGGSGIDEGDETHQANLMRTKYGLTGKGVKVGVMSDSVQYLATAQGSGNLPAYVQILANESGLDYGGEEGTAMLEIVHGLAPNAPLEFGTAYYGQANFAQNILNLAKDGCKVIVDDWTYYAEPAFQDGIVAQAVNQVVSQGVHFFACAGNEGRVSAGTGANWQGDFKDSGQTVSGHPAHTFGTSITNKVLSVRWCLNLQWSDPQGKSSNDYDLYVVDANGNVVDVSDDNQTGTQNPYEECDGPDAGNFAVVVKRSGDSRFLRLSALRGQLAVNVNGQVFNHGTAEGATSVAAADIHGVFPSAYTENSPLERFSSDGPRKMFFTADGTPYTPGNFLSSGGTVRRKPDLTAADGVTTTIPNFTTFYGTSAAAPHAAAIAADLLEADPTVAPVALRDNVFAKSAWAKTGVDAGSGIINALSAGDLFITNHTSLVFPSASIIGGTSGTASVSLSTSQPLSVDLSYSLTSNNPAIVVPAKVVIPAGKHSANFSFKSVAPTSASVIVKISAILPNSLWIVSKSLTVLKSEAISALTVRPLVGTSTSVVGGNTVHVDVSLVAPAPIGGTAVSLTSSSAVIPVPIKITVFAGQTTGSYVGTTAGVDANTDVTVAATIGTQKLSAHQIVLPATVSFVTLTPSTVIGGSSALIAGKVSLNGAIGPTPLTILLSSSSVAAKVPASVGIAKGGTSGTFTATSNLVSLSTVATITAKARGASVVAKETVNPYLISSVTVSPAKVVGSSSTTVSLTVVLNAPASASGLVVSLSSSNVAASLTATGAFKAGETSHSFAVTHSKVTANTSVNLKVTYGTSTKTVVLVVTP